VGGKGVKGKARKPHEWDNDKPLWALDPELRRPGQRPSSDAAERTPAGAGLTELRAAGGQDGFGAALEEAVGDAVRGRLAALKAELEANQPQGKAVSGTGAGGARTGKKPQPSARAKEEDEASFAELFEPRDEEGMSFEELLNQSKLDWKAFK
jgi:hypothetical protein